MTHTSKWKLAATAAVTAALSLGFAYGTGQARADTGWQTLATTEARTDNPLKGFAPFNENLDNNAPSFPHTMEWFYMPLNAVVKGERNYDWTEFEQQLSSIKSRGHQAALRFYLDYPTKPTGVPDYLLGPNGIDQSRKYNFYDNNGNSFSPDYNDPRVQSLIKDFVAEFGKNYDGDPRIGYITTGLIGFWGEQHTYPMDGNSHTDNPNIAQWMPTREVELSYYQAWDAAFNTTKLLNRSPGPGLENIKIGFHDDSFAESTLPTIDWHFMARMQTYKLTERWQTEAIGGEVYPEIQRCVFNEPTDCNHSEDFNEATTQTHATWLVNHKAFSEGYSGAALEKATKAHAALGYDLAVTQTRTIVKDGKTQVSIRLTNRGVAPFYYNWPLEFSLINPQESTPESTKTVTSTQTDANLPSLLPGQTTEVTATLEGNNGMAALRIPNPMEGGAPLKFANTEQDTTFPGYLTLGSVSE